MAASIDKKAFGQFIGRYRETRGLTQGALAEAAGISRPYLAQIEGGTRLPSDDVMQKLVILTGASMQTFLHEVVGPALTQDESEAMGAILAPWDALTEQLRPEQMLDFAEKMMTVDQMAGALSKLSGLEGPQIGPEGWSELSKEDRRLVQRLVNRLRATSAAPASTEKEGE